MIFVWRNQTSANQRSECIWHKKMAVHTKGLEKHEAMEFVSYLPWSVNLAKITKFAVAKIELSSKCTGVGKSTEVYTTLQ